MTFEDTTTRFLPELRFPEFVNDAGWEEKRLDSFIDEHREKSSVQDQHSVLTSSRGGLVKQSEYFEEGRLTQRNNIGFNVLPENCITYRSRSDDGIFFFNENRTGETGIVSIFYPVFRIKNGSPGFFLSTFSRYRDKIGSHGVGNAQKVLSLNELRTVRLPLPSIREQEKIAGIVSTLDSTIAVERDALNEMKSHKCGLLQKLLPQSGQVLPQLRFPEFKNTGDWVERPLGSQIDYEQPTPYLVSNSNYRDDYETPVLTAGKTFILGHTNEKEGVFSDGLPVVIFDDFTTSVQFVDFPFKAKSSAMKILRAKPGVNIKFVFEAIGRINYDVTDHQRHWISIFSPMLVAFPPTRDEQDKIADCISSIDELIGVQTARLNALQDQKTGLLQGLFPYLRQPTL